MQSANTERALTACDAAVCNGVILPWAAYETVYIKLPGDWVGDLQVTAHILLSKIFL